MITKLLGDGATVTESKALREMVSGEPREVDVCVEGAIGGQPVIVSIECRDYKRKQGVEFVETMLGKHASLPTNLLILVSSSGFTKTALAKAEKANIKAITPSQITDKLADEIAAKVGSIATVAAMTVEVVSANITTGWPQEWMDEEQLPFPDDIPMFRPDGSELVKLNAYEMDILVKHVIAHPQEWMAPGGPEEIDFEVQVNEPRYEGEVPYFSVSLVDTPLAETDPHPRRLLPLQRIIVYGKARITRTTPKLASSGTYDGTTYYAGTSPAGEGTSQYVVVETPQGTKGMVTFQVDGGPPKPPRKKTRSRGAKHRNRR